MKHTVVSVLLLSLFLLLRLVDLWAQIFVWLALFQRRSACAELDHTKVLDWTGSEYPCSAHCCPAHCWGTLRGCTSRKSIGCVVSSWTCAFTCTHGICHQFFCRQSYACQRSWLLDTLQQTFPPRCFQFEAKTRAQNRYLLCWQQKEPHCQKWLSLGAFPP